MLSRRYDYIPRLKGSLSVHDGARAGIKLRSYVAKEGAMALTSAALLDQLREAAPPRQSELDGIQLARLRSITQGLTVLRPEALRELERFEGIADRSLLLAATALPGDLSNSRILVTGGTGCIGGHLIQQLLAGCAPGAVMSVSRGVTEGARLPGVDYEYADVRSAEQVRRVMRRFRPDYVFNLAAVRDPGAAELEVRRTIQTNIGGLTNVRRSAIDVGTFGLVQASTGKALRFLTRDVYAATKKLCEWQLFAKADDSLRVAATRFTHVVDNSLIAEKMRGWVEADSPLRLHDPLAAFYAQSAKEAAQLLIVAAVGLREGKPVVTAIRDLGWPFELLDLALGTIRRSGRTGAIYVSGYTAGYEAISFPGLYDPRFAGETGPLVNSLECAGATWTKCGGQIVQFPLLCGDTSPSAGLDGLLDSCSANQPVAALREGLHKLSVELLQESIKSASGVALDRVRRLSSPTGSIAGDHADVFAAICSELLRRSSALAHTG